MRDCANADMRDLLPELVHERLDADARDRVATHVAGCAECATEVALLRELREALGATAAPGVDVSRIVAALPSAPRRGAGVRPAPSATPLDRRGWATPRLGWVAAATLALTVGVGSWQAFGRDGAPQAGRPAEVAVASPGAPAEPAGAARTGGDTPVEARGRPAAAPRPRAPLVGDLSVYSDDELAALLAMVEELEGVPSEETVDAEAVDTFTNDEEGR